MSLEKDNKPKQEPKATLLWHSVAPWIESGYGRLTRNALSRIVNSGYRCICSAYYGMEPGGILNYNGITVVASKEGQFGIQSAAKYAQQFKVDFSILTTDWWAFSDFPSKMPNPILHSPMDHIDYPPEIIDFTKKYWKIVALCKWQQKEMQEKMGVKSTFIPHGVDTSVYKPLDRNSIKKIAGIPEDTFVFGSINANSDKEMGGGRKSWGPTMKAMRYFLDQHQDVKEKNLLWMIHTNPIDPRGFPLLAMANKFRLSGIIKFSHPDIHSTAMSEEDMVSLYNTFNIFLGCSKREGFGLTFLEAESCGVPVITHNFSSMPELVKGHGWLAKSVSTDLNMELTPILADTCIPDVYDIARCIEDAYFHPDLVRKYGLESRDLALKYDWKNVIKDGWVPFLDSASEELKCKTTKERMLF